MLLTQPHWRIAARAPPIYRRAVSTLPNNPYIYAHQQSPSTYTLSYLSTTPTNGSLAIGTTSKLPPTPDSLKENPNFLRILHSVIKANATRDPDVISQARAYASTAGSALGSGGMFFPQQHKRTQKRKAGVGGGGGTGGDGAGGASAQGGAGGAGRGGHIHVSDLRAPPDYGRIAWPEDIFGSLEVDAEGAFVGGDGGYQESGTYRIITREGILGLSDHLRGKLIERLKELEKEGGR